MKILLLIMLLNLLSVALLAQTESEKKVFLPPKKFKERIRKQEFSDVPQSVRNSHARGTFTIRVIVDKDGKVKKAAAVTKFSNNISEYLEKAVVSWRFKPLEVDGERVSFRGILQIPFCYNSFSSWCLD